MLSRKDFIAGLSQLRGELPSNGPYRGLDPSSLYELGLYFLSKLELRHGPEGQGHERWFLAHQQGDLMERAKRYLSTCEHIVSKGLSGESRSLHSDLRTARCEPHLADSLPYF